jgi:glycosyltransferase involved in cell wall biosynthesis
VHVVWGSGFGGIERFVSDLAAYQASVMQTAVGVLACGATTDDPLLSHYASPGVSVVGGGLRSGLDIRRGSVATLVTELSTFDVIHLHSFTPLVALAAWRANRPVVFTEHGSLGLGNSRPWRSGIIQAAKGFYLRRRGVAVACISRWVRETAKKRYRLADDRLSLVPDGVDFSRIVLDQPRQGVLGALAVDASAWVIVVTARLVDFKRIDRLLDALSRLRSDGRAWALVVGGSGPLEQQLREQATRLGIADKVHFLGFRTDVWDLVGAADMVAVPSEHEPFGLVVLEAMALDRPVVAFADSGGPAEVIQVVGGGCVVDSVEALTTVLEQSRAGGRIDGLRALDSARLRAYYSIGRVAEDYGQLYSAVLERRPKGARS